MCYTVGVKPEDVSWDAIAECQQIAHESNHLKGIDQLCSHLTGEQLREKVGQGTCFVALDDNRKVIGIVVLQEALLKTWYHKGKASLFSFDAVLPEYRGKGVFKALYKMRESEAQKKGFSFSFLTTAENNYAVRNMYQKKGFRLVALTPSTRGANYYSVVLANWEKGCPWSRFTCRIMYVLSFIAVKALYKPGRIRRFFNWR